MPPSTEVGHTILTPPVPQNFVFHAKDVRFMGAGVADFGGGFHHSSHHHLIIIFPAVTLRGTTYG
jgi:hypothetical protein